MAKNLTKKQQRNLIARIQYYIGKNYTDDEICSILEIRPNFLKGYKKKILQRDKLAFDQLDKNAVYSDYLIKQHQLLRECDHLRVKFNNKGQWTALVAAIKLKSDINDKIIKVGQELGLIERKIGEIKIEGEMSISAMSNEEVEKKIEVEAQRMISMTTQNIIPIRPELLDIAGEGMKEVLPPNVKILSTKKIKQIHIKTKVTLKRLG